MTSVSLSTQPAATVRADALVIGVKRTPSGPALIGGGRELTKPVRGLLRTLELMGATGNAEEVVKVPAPAGLGVSVLVAVGLGDYGRRSDPEVLRRAAGAAVRALAGTKKVAFALPAESPEQAAAIATGASLGGYVFRDYRVASHDRFPAEPGTALITGTPADRATRTAIKHAATVAAAVRLARDLVNTPPSDLYPATMAQRAEAVAAELPLEVTVLDERALKRGKFGGILGVGQGSARPPRLVRIAYRHPKATQHLALVGKGITFDTGGISIKPALHMEAMKSDMSGGAAVLAALTAIAELGPVVNVTGWIPLAENMPSGSAQRPSDILTMYGGKTVEVLNTDAEGRLVLADALVRAGEENPDVLVDVATLTGAQLVALGTRTSAIMANDDGLRDRVHAAATQVGEAMWPMPLPEHLRPSIDSSVADLANVGERMGGMLVAGLFLREFVPEGVRWAHLDIAGPAYHEGEPYGYVTKGGTGAAVRTLVRLAEELASGTL